MTGEPPTMPDCKLDVTGSPVIRSTVLLCRPVAILYARSDSIYKTLEGCDVWDATRDARNFPGGCPVVAHPPCRAWSALAHLAKPRPDEKDLARHAVKVVRECGGVLEHPISSRLWADQKLPQPGERAESIEGVLLWLGRRIALKDRRLRTVDAD